MFRSVRLFEYTLLNGNLITRSRPVIAEYAEWGDGDKECKSSVRAGKWRIFVHSDHLVFVLESSTQLTDRLDQVL